MSLKIVVGGLVVNEDAFVIVKEKKGPIAGLWNLPVGGLEYNEKIVYGARREIKEETGLDVHFEGLLGIYQNPKRPNGQNVVKFIFLAKTGAKQLRCPNDLEDVTWMSFEEFKKIPRQQWRDDVIDLAIRDYLAGRLYPLEMCTYYG